MFEGIREGLSAWREIVHVSEWTGLSLGALAGLGALIYFVPLARKLAIAAAITVLVGWACLIHGDATGRADVEAQWADARKAAIAAEADRDAMAELKLEAKYQPQLIDLQKQSDARKARSDSYERQIMALLAKSPAGKGPSPNSCLLGVAADRLRRK